MPNDSHRPDVAVFIDFENVYVSVRDKLDANPNFEMIMDRCEDFGRVVIAHRDTVIESGDHVIIFCVRKKLVRRVEKLFQVGFGFL